MRSLMATDKDRIDVGDTMARSGSQKNEKFIVWLTVREP